MSATRASLLAAGLLAALTAASFPGLVRGRVPLPGDILRELYPWAARAPAGHQAKNPLLHDCIVMLYPYRERAIERLRRGDLPLWDPDSFCGAPFLANVHSAALYPANLLGLVLPPLAVQTIIILAQPVLAGLFMFWFLGALGLGRFGSLVGALAYAFNGFFVQWMEWGTVVTAAMYLPLALLLVERYARSRRAGYLAGLALVVGVQFLAGHAQIAAHALLVTGAFAIWRLSLERTRRVVGAAAVIGGIVLGLGVAAVQILPTAQLTRYGSRPPPSSYREAGPLPARHLAGLALPHLYGNPVDRTWGPFWTAAERVLSKVARRPPRPAPGIGAFGEYCAYAGIVPLLLAGAAVVWRRDRYTWFFLAVTVIAILMALGTPLYAPVFLLVPGLRAAAVSRIIWVALFGIAALAALGADSLLPERAEEHRRAPLRRTAIVLGAAGVVLLVAAATAFAIRDQLAARVLALKAEVAGGGPADYADKAALALHMVLLWARENLLVPGLLLMAGGAAFALAAAGRRRAFQVVALAALAFDLVAFARHQLVTCSPKEVHPPSQSLALVQRAARDHPLDRTVALGDNTFPPDLHLAYGLPSIEGFSSLHPRAYVSLARAYDPGVSHHFVDFNRGAGSPLFDVLGVRWILTRPGLAMPAGYRKVLADDCDVYENPRALPRAFLTRLPPGSPTAVVDVLARTTPVGRAGVTSYRPERVEVAVAAEEPCFLVLTDVWAPGWRAAVDGRPRPIAAAAGALRAVEIRPGDRRVVFAYAPRSVRLGVALSLAALAGCGLLVVLGALRREP